MKVCEHNIYGPGKRCRKSARFTVVYRVKFADCIGPHGLTPVYDTRQEFLCQDHKAARASERDVLFVTPLMMSPTQRRSFPSGSAGSNAWPSFPTANVSAS